MTQTTWIIAEIFAGIALLMVLIAILTRMFPSTDKRGPAEILKERYARGELSRAEYHQMAEDLGIAMPQVNEPRTPPPDEGVGASPTSRHAVES